MSLCLCVHGLQPSECSICSTDALLREAAVRAHHHGLTDPEWALMEQAQKRSAADAASIPGNYPGVSASPDPDADKENT